MNTNNSNSKRVQVFSSFIEIPHNNQPEKKVPVQAKKQKLNEKLKKKAQTTTSLVVSSASEDNDENDYYENLDYNFMYSFIGLNHFNCENVFPDLIDQDLILINLDNSCKLKKKYLSFKGKCSLALVHGQIEINGYNLSKNLMSQYQNNALNGQIKWYDLYSPESNSFLSIINKSNKAEQDLDSDKSLNIQISMNEIKNIATSLNINIQNQIEENIIKFLALNEFSFNTSSLIAIKPLKSQFCNYLSYFENFQHVYQSLSNFASTKLSTSNEINWIIDKMDKLIANMGLYSIPLERFDNIYLASDEAKNVAKNLAKDNNNEVIMVCGGKDVGKSTFLRFTVNSLLNSFNQIAYLDCDPGQSEFTLSTCITLTIVSEPLFGPPHTHISHSDNKKICYFVGHLSPSDGPGHYMRCLSQCFSDFTNYKASLNENQKNIPLLINTMGWNQGLGLCLLKESILLFKPTVVIQLNHPIEANKNMPVLDKEWLNKADGWPHIPKKYLEKNGSHMDIDLDETKSDKNDSTIMIETDSLNDINYKLVQLKSNVPCKSAKNIKNSIQKKFSARDHRNIAILTYFSNLFEPCSFFSSINNLRPYKISWSKLALHVSHSKVDFDQYFRVFNASLVGLCQIDKKYIKRKQENSELPGYLESNYEIDKKTPIVYRCFGFGIIRGINIETKEFYILTPESIETLSFVNLLTKGMLNLPLEFFYEQESDSACPYMSYSDNFHNENHIEKHNLNVISNQSTQRKYLVHQSYTKSH